MKDSISNVIAAAALTLPFLTVAEWLQVWSLIAAIFSVLWLARQLWVSFKKTK